MTVRVCIAIRETTTEAARAAARSAAAWADLVEFRADYIRDLDVRGLHVEKPCPVLFTLRAGNEGGEYSGSEVQRIATLIKAAEEGADFVDVEFSGDWKSVLGSVPSSRVILSYHNFEETPGDLEARLDSMAASGAGILKIVTRARGLADNARIARLLGYAGSRRLNLIALAMGREGIPSRILNWGSWLTFASMPGGRPTAEGQIPADVMVNLFRIRRIGRQTQVYGVLGRPLTHSLSPLIHNAAFAAQGREAVFLPLEAASVADFIDFQETCRLAGCSVTIPFKIDVRAALCSSSVAADRIGAVNTLVRNEKGWHGENTDVDGFLRPLLARLDLSGARSVVLGSGGAARAAVYALRSQGASVVVLARNTDKARALSERFQAGYESWERLPALRWDLLVNTTPVGMHPNADESPVPQEWLTGEWVYDLVYNPAETRLLREASRRGCKTVPGSEMFLGQALRQQELWFGAQGPEEVMKAALQHALGAADH